jgi:hypothetical protein
MPPRVTLNVHYHWDWSNRWTEVIPFKGKQRNKIVNSSNNEGGHCCIKTHKPFLAFTPSPSVSIPIQSAKSK